MYISPSISVSTLANDVVASNVGSLSYMGNAQFMQLLLAQLRYQNPLDPLQNEEMIMQLTQINSLQELQMINRALTELSRSSQIASASNLIGKTVMVACDDGSFKEGVVTGVSIIENEVMLWLGEEVIPLSSVVKVVETPEESA